jgi:hypothetical protein
VSSRTEHYYVEFSRAKTACLWVMRTIISGCNLRAAMYYPPPGFNHGGALLQPRLHPLEGGLFKGFWPIKSLEPSRIAPDFVIFCPAEY